MTNSVAEPGTDSFYFRRPDFGADTISDFVDGTDMLDFSASGLVFADLTVVSGADTTITVTSDAANVITHTGIAGGIDASDFIF